MVAMYTKARVYHNGLLAIILLLTCTSTLLTVDAFTLAATNARTIARSIDFIGTYSLQSRTTNPKQSSYYHHKHANSVTAKSSSTPLFATTANDDLKASISSATVNLPAVPLFENVASHLEARARVDYLKSSLPRPKQPLKVLVMGGGLAGLSTAKHLVDAGHLPIVLEARSLLGGKVAAWRDAKGDVTETGLHVFFGAYPNTMNLFDDLDISDRLQWKSHQLLFAKPGRPTREFDVFDFPTNLPAPFNTIVAILSNDKMLTWPEKIKLGLGLVPAYLFGQSYVEDQEGLTVQEWMDSRGIPQSVTDEIFSAMSKALGFIGPERLSMQCVLIALNRFLQESSGSRIAFLDGSPTERLCEPLREYIQARGGLIRTDAPVKRILLNSDKTVAGLLLKGQEVVSGDAYVNAMPVDALKKLTPEPWRDLDYFKKMQKLRGVPVINIHIWFDRKLSTIDNLIFSRSKILSVYADMSETCRDYANQDGSMLELVLAPAAKYMSKTDDEILQATMSELEQLFPQEISVDNSLAKVVKYTLVRTPTSVYETVPGVDDARPSQKSPISNFYCAGDFSRQKYLASMEGAVLSGLLAATEVANDYVKSVREQTDTAKQPRKLTERPFNSKAADANDRTPDLTMYVATVAQTIPKEVEEELMNLNPVV